MKFLVAYTPRSLVVFNENNTMSDGRNAIDVVTDAAKGLFGEDKVLAAMETGDILQIENMAYMYTEADNAGDAVLKFLSQKEGPL